MALSPAILPGQNFMLDVPALALGLAGLAVFVKGCDRGSLGLAIGAGLIAGVAINTKWTGLLAPAAIGLYGVTHRRVGLGVIAVAASAAVFGGWEAWLAHEYGRSHFLFHSERKGSPPLMDRINGARALVSILGGVAPGVLVTGLVGLGRPRSAAIVAGIVVARDRGDRGGSRTPGGVSAPRRAGAAQPRNGGGAVAPCRKATTFWPCPRLRTWS